MEDTKKKYSDKSAKNISQWDKQAREYPITTKEIPFQNCNKTFKVRTEHNSIPKKPGNRAYGEELK